MIEKNSYSCVGIFEKSLLYPQVSQSLMNEKLKFRAPGAVALSLSQAYYVNYVLFLGTMRPYDIEAGLYICKDLYKYVSDTVLLVSKDKKIFDRIFSILKDDHELI
jgi:myo-inositol-1(or 4)-monophosphatase